MGNKIEVFVDPNDVGELVIDLSQIEGIQVELPTKKLLPPDEARVHPDYGIPFQELATIIISATGMITSFVALAATILNYLSEKEKAKSSRNKDDTNQPYIVINQQVITIAEFSSSEELALFLEERLS